MKDKKDKERPGIEALLEYANSIIATLREPFLVLDKSLRVISANSSFYTTFKVTEKDTIGCLLHALGDKQWNIPKLLQLLKEILPGKKVVKDYEVEHKFEQIGERVMILNARQLRVPKKIAGIIATGIREEEEEEELILLAIEDITERKRLQVELQASDERYRRAFETSRDGLLLVHKTEADILNANESIEELLGYSHEEFLKKKLWEIGVVKDYQDFKGVVSRLEIDGVLRYEDAPVKNKKGLSMNTEVFLTNKAKVIQCNIRDITERRRNEELISIMNEQQKTILNASPEMIFYKDKENRYIHVNEALAKAVGMSPEDVEGKTMWDIYPREAAEHYWQDDKEVIASGKPKLKIIETMETSKGTIWVETNKVPYKDASGDIIGVIGFVTDITDRKNAEDSLKEAVKAKSAFTSMVSHELRTPLAALKESISQILEGMLGTLTADQRKFLEIAKRNVDRLARLITEVLDFQTLETGKMIFRMQDNDINEVIKETKETMDIIAKEKRLDFILNLDKDLPKVKFDSDKISQVLSNLVNNSIKLTEKGNITISTTRGNNVIQVSVKDTGPGIKEEDMPRLFQQYEQLERKTGGTGLGLAISLEIIKAHGGRIWAESKFGHGTTMHFILPIEERRRRT